jgi:hypothetical protein
MGKRPAGIERDHFHITNDVLGHIFRNSSRGLAPTNSALDLFWGLVALVGRTLISLSFRGESMHSRLNFWRDEIRSHCRYGDDSQIKPCESTASSTVRSQSRYRWAERGVIALVGSRSFWGERLTFGTWKSFFYFRSCKGRAGSVYRGATNWMSHKPKKERASRGAQRVVDEIGQSPSCPPPPQRTCESDDHLCSA